MYLTIDGETFSLDAFTLAYLECALWSSCDEDGNPLDDAYDVIDLEREAVHQACRDCDSFRAYVRETIGDDTADEIDCDRGGHDLWLTRNGHGAGFWDGDWERGDELSDAAHTFGSCDLFVHDGKVHAS